MAIDKITADGIADNAIGTSKIGADVIVAEDIAANAITVSEIQDNAVTTAKVADNAVTTAKITDANITTDKIADLGVTHAKLHNTMDLSSKTVTLPSLADLTVTGDLTVDTDTLKTDATNNKVFINRTSQVSSHDAFVVSSPAGGVGGGSTRVNATITAEDLTGDGGAHANAFVVTKAKGNYYNGLEISSTSAHIGGWIGHYNGGDNYRALQARIGGTGINASDIMAMKIDVNGVVSMPVRGILRGVNVEGVAGGYSPASVVVTATFPDVGYASGIIQASAGHYGVTNHAAHRLSMFQSGPYFGEFNVYNHTNSAQGAWSFSWSGGTLTVTKSAGTYAGGGPYSIFVAWGRS